MHQGFAFGFVKNSDRQCLGALPFLCYQYDSTTVAVVPANRSTAEFWRLQYFVYTSHQNIITSHTDCLILLIPSIDALKLLGVNNCFFLLDVTGQYHS